MVQNLAEALKILFVTHAPKNDRTAVYHAYALRAKYLKDMGGEGRVLSPGDLWLSSRAGRFVPVVYPMEAALWILCQKGHFDLIVFHSYAGWFFNVIRRFFCSRSAAVITAFHGVEELYFEEVKKEAEISGQELSPLFKFFYLSLQGKWIRLSTQLSDRVFCLNKQERDFLIHQHYSTGAKVTAVHNDVAPEFFTKRDYSKNFKTILYAGQWLPMKGTRYLVEAFEALAGDFPDLELHLAGTLASETQVLKDFPSSVRGRIKVIASLPHERMIECYQTADVFIFPSLYEAFGRVVVEAMATGLPVISTRVGIGLEIFEDKKNCMIIPRRDSSAIVSAVKAVCSDAPLREKIGRAGRVSVESLRTDIVLKQIFDEYSYTVKESRLRYEQK